MRKATLVAAVAGCALFVAACSGTPAADEATASGSPQTSLAQSEAGTPTATGGVKTKRSVVGVQTELELGPAYRFEKGTLIPVRVAGQGLPHEIDVSYAWTAGESLPDTSGFVVVDFEKGTVLPGATNTEPSFSGFGGDAGSLTTYVVVGKTSSETVDVLVPLSGMVYDVPVIDAPLPAEAKEFIAGIETDSFVEEALPLHEYRESLKGEYDSAEAGESLEVNLAADVLFAVDSADLSPDADRVLQEVLTTLEPYSSGELRIVGHTDSNADDAYNQDLSEKRARSVHDRLQVLAPLTRFTISVEGRGESEPRVEETDDASRQINRRVELSVTGKIAESRMPASGATLPPAPAASAEGSNPVNIKQDVSEEQMQVQIASMKRQGKYLVGELSVACPSCSDGFLWAPFSHVLSAAPHPDDEPQGSYNPATRLTLLVGNERVYPVEFAESEGMLLLTDPNLYRTGSEPSPPQYTVTAVWPDPGTDRVTIDVDGERTGSESWRISDIPVK